MINLTQDARQLRIDTPLGKDFFLLQSLSGAERLSRPFEYEAIVLSKEPTVDGNAMVGKPIAITYHNEDGRDRHFNGYVSRFEYFQQVEEPEEYAAYRVTIVPWLWFLRHNQDCQIFQDLTTPEIIQKVFQDRGFTDFQLQLGESYSTREYCVQYRETDFDFVSRLMGEEGIFYYFKHKANKHELVICDSTSGYWDTGEDVNYEQSGQDHYEQLTDWRHVYEFRPGRIAQKDYNFKDPKDALNTKETSNIQFAGAANLEIFEYPGRYEETGNGGRLTKVRKEELEAEHDHVEGSGFYTAFSPGGKFTIGHHPRPDERGQSYTLVEVITELNSNLGFGHDGTVDFKNTFRCIPSKTVFRPERLTRKPFVEGPQTAIVVTDGQEIVVDEHARVKVQFHWDRYGNNDVNSSCWIRVSQVHAGAGWGMMDIPRQHEEVIVSFLDGDPDRPIITGRVYNGMNNPPFDMKGAGNNKKNKTRRGNKTKSYGGSGYNEMTMDDTPGEEQIRIHSQYNMNTTVQNDQILTVNNNRTKTIAVNETNSIGVDQSEEIGSNRTTDVGANDSETVGANQNINIGANQSVSIGADQSTTIGTKQSTQIGMIKHESVGVAANQMVGVAKASTVGVVQNEAVGFLSFEQVGLKKSTVVGTKYGISTGTKFEVSAGTKLELKCGASKISMDASGVITIEGTALLMTSSGPVKINGSVIDLN